MNPISRKATMLGIAGNSALFVLKVFIGFIYNSLAIISDAFNSLTDIISSIIVYISIKVSSKSADHSHPFGHHRAEPIAGLVIAIFTGVLGFQIILMAIRRIISSDKIIHGIAPMIVLLFTIIIKLGMYIYTTQVYNKTKSVALKASASDHRNDILISSGALIGVAGAFLGYPIMDTIVALMIGLWIIKAGFNIGLDNLKFLMGAAPPNELTAKIEKKVLLIKGIDGVHDIRAHYVGIFLHVEAHINVNKKMPILKAHNIGKKAQKAIEDLPEVEEAFIHIDPV